MNRDDAARIERLVTEAALRADASKDDAAGLQRLVNEVAHYSDMAVADVVQWPVERLQRYIAEMHAELETGMRANIRQAIALERITTLTEVEGMPSDMTVDEGIGQRIITREQVEAAQEVTEADIDTAIARVKAAQQVTEADIDAVIDQIQAT